MSRRSLALSLTATLLLRTCSPFSLSFLARAFAEPILSKTNLELGAVAAAEDDAAVAADDSASNCDDLPRRLADSSYLANPYKYSVTQP